MRAAMCHGSEPPTKRFQGTVPPAIQCATNMIFLLIC
jgi:hypothetical protein